MRQHLRLLMVIASLVIAAGAQYGTARNNYYPDSYNGSIFTGMVSDATPDQITLTFTRGSKTDTFVGHFETDCSVPSTDGRAMTHTDIPKETSMTVFFNTNTRTIDGKKTKENVIIAIAFEIWHGQKVAEDKKKIYWCTKDRHLQFRAYQ